MGKYEGKMVHEYFYLTCFTADPSCDPKKRCLYWYMCLKLEHDDFENRGLFFETKTTVYAPYSTGEKVIWKENMVLV